MKSAQELAQISQAFYYAVMAQFMSRDHAQAIWKKLLNTDFEELVKIKKEKND